MPYAKSVALSIFSKLDYRVTPLFPRYMHSSKAKPFLLNVKQVFQRSLAAFNAANDVRGVDHAHYVHGVGHGVGHGGGGSVHHGGHHVDHHDRRDVNHAHEAIGLGEADFRKLKSDSENPQQINETWHAIFCMRILKPSYYFMLTLIKGHFANTHLSVHHDSEQCEDCEKDCLSKKKFDNS